MSNKAHSGILTREEKICHPTVLVCFLLSVIIYCSVASFSLIKPFTLDEAIPIAQNASAINTYGLKAMGFSSPAHPHRPLYEVAHPLLYHYLLSIHFSIFGENTVSGRLPGVFCFVIMLLLALKISKQLFPGNKGSVVGILAIFLFSVNPFSIQNSLLLDIDTTILPVLIMIFYYGFLRSGAGKTISSIVVLAILFAMCLWAKEITPYFVLLSMLIYLSLARNVRSALTISCLIGLLGTLLFIISWTIFCHFTNVPILSFVEFSVINKAFNVSLHSGISLRAILYHLSFSSRWLTPAMCLLLFASFIKRLVPYFKYPRRITQSDFLWIFVIIYWAITNFVMYSTKYQYPVYGLAFILVAEYIYETLSGNDRKIIVIAVVLGVIVGLLASIIPHEPLYEQTFLRQGAGQKLSFLEEYLTPETYIVADVVIFTLIPLIIAIIIHLLFFNSYKFYNICILSLISCLIASCLSLNLKQTKPYTTALSWNLANYGERGFWETLDYLKQRIGNSRPVVRKDFGYYLSKGKEGNRVRWIYNMIFRNVNDKEKALSIVQDPQVKYVVVDICCNPENTVEIIHEHFELKKIIGDFRIYLKRSYGSESESNTNTL